VVFFNLGIEKVAGTKRRALLASSYLKQVFLPHRHIEKSGAVWRLILKLTLRYQINLMCLCGFFNLGIEKVAGTKKWTLLASSYLKQVFLPHRHIEKSGAV
jgi:hypothetical protein